MNKRRYAAVDIGTNTILMIIADVYPDNSYEVIRDIQEIARLGEGFSIEKKILPSAFARACNILEEFRSICSELKVDKILAYGTSALREARNREQAIAMLSASLGSPVRAIPGEDEARLSFCGTVENYTPSIVIDIGGGSTEIVHGQGDLIYYRMSLPVGAVKITEKYLQKFPYNPAAIESAKEEIKNFFALIDWTGFEGILYAVAGTPTTLAAVLQSLKEYDPVKVHGYHLNLEAIQGLLDSFLALKPEEISQKHNIHPLRADVISAGAMILAEALKHFKLESCKVSNWGLRYGILKAMINP